MIQLIGKCQLGTLGTMYENIICFTFTRLILQQIKTFFHLVEDTKISATVTVAAIFRHQK
jgi:hypothetical protein